MNKLEALKQKLENQIEATMDTVIAIWELEKAKPWRQLSNWHQVWVSRIFHSILAQSCYETKLKGLTQEQAFEYIVEVWNMTHEHYLNLYWFDAKKLWNVWA